MADDIDGKTLQKMKVADLKKVLKARGLSVTGSKIELLERLEIFMKEHGDLSFQNAEEGTAKSPEEAVVGETTDEPNEDEVLGDDSLEEDSTLHDTTPELTPVEQIEMNLPPEDIPKTDEGLVLNDEKAIDDTSLEIEAKTVTLKNVQALTVAERKQLRAAKFSSLVSEDQKKLARAERFGLPDSKTSALSSLKITAVAPELDKLKKRAERFGSISPKIQKVEEAEKLRKRKERFGIATPISTNSDDSEAKKLKRAERFGLA